MTSFAYQKIIQAIEITNGEAVTYNANGCYCKCPYHGGKNKKLYIADGESRVLMHCKSGGCDPKDILESVGLSIKDVFHKQLLKDEIERYQAIKKNKQLKKELEFEILILMQWITATKRGNREDINKDKDRIIKALRMVYSSTDYFIKNQSDI